MKKDSRFKYFKQENKGLPTARNSGIKIAEGEWILPLDADDKIGDKYLELCYNEIKKGYNLICAQVMLFGTTTEFISHPIGNLLYTNNYTCSCIFEKSKWERVGGFDESLVDGLEDWEFWINLTYNTDIKASVIKDYIGFYYRRKEMSMDVSINQSKDKFNNSMEYIIRKHAKHYADNVCSIQEQIFLLKRTTHSINLLKNSRIIKFLNSIGILKWISRI